MQQLTKFSVVIPTASNDGQELTPQIVAVKQSIMTETGGCSMYAQEGAWIDTETTREYSEPSIVFYTLCSSIQAHRLLDLAHEWAHALQQIELLVWIEEVHAIFVKGIRQRDDSAA